MSGEELLLLRILNGKSVAATIDAELDRRARTGPGQQAATSIRSSCLMSRRRRLARVASAA
jgi:hypothetical protein